MGIEVPPAPSHETAADIMERLSRFADNEPKDEEASSRPRMSRALPLASCVLSALGSLLLACSIAISCAPESAVSQAVLAVCTLLP